MAAGELRRPRVSGGGAGKWRVGNRRVTAGGQREWLWWQAVVAGE
ncbi:hypothetical protein [Lentzea sp. CA-135723]